MSKLRIRLVRKERSASRYSAWWYVALSPWVIAPLVAPPVGVIAFNVVAGGLLDMRSRGPATL